MRASTKIIVGTAALTLVGAGLSGASAHGSGGATAVGLADGGTTLASFRVDRPSRATTATLSGLQLDTALVGIDRRVQDGQLYGVGNQGGIYVLDARSGTATLQDRPRVPLDGSAAYGVDFNPAANALRITSSSGANLRVPFATAAAAVADTPLTRPAVAPATGSVPATGVTAAAYTNNDLDAATATTLFVLDTERDQVAVQSPANAGTLAATGSPGIDLATDSGFDVYSELRRGRTTSVQAFAVSDHVLYEIDLLTGTAEKVGRLGAAVTDIAVSLDR